MAIDMIARAMAMDAAAGGGVDPDDAYTKAQTDALLSGKVDKEAGKGLSTEDFTTAEKEKLSGIEAGAEENVNADWEAESGDAQILHKPTLGTAAAADTTTSIASGGTGLPTAGTVYDDQQRQEAEIGAVANAGAKNLWKLTIPSNLPSGFTITQDTDGGYIFNGTAGSSGVTCTTNVRFKSGKSYILSGCPSGGSDESYRLDILRGQNSNYCYGDPVVAGSFTATEYPVRVRIAPNYQCDNLKFYPMLRYADISDDTFVPYALPNVPITSELIELVDNCAKNHINSAGVLTSGTIGGIAYTINADESITVAAGTATSNSDLVVDLSLTAGVEYVLSGCLNGGGGTTYKAQVVRGSALTEVVNVQSSTASASFTPTAGETYKWRFRVYNGKSVPSGTFYPMLCTKAAWDVSQKYVPYCPSMAEMYQRTLYPSTIPDSSDLNNYKTPGLYNCENSTHSATISNKPSAGTGAGFVLRVSTTSTSSCIRQEYIKPNEPDKLFVRHYTTSGTWTAWHVFAGSDAT